MAAPTQRETKQARKVWPRQPLIGLALVASGAIFIADHFPHSATGLLVAGLLAVIALLRKSSIWTYLFAASCFFSLHSFRITESPGLSLARGIGGERQAATVRGLVVTEPKTSERGSASFLLRLESIEQNGETRACDAVISARWPGAVIYGDELRLFGVVGPIEGPRNPGEFDMRSYLERHDVRTAIVSRYAENGAVIGHPGGHPILRAAHASRRWMDAALARGTEDSPETHALVSAMALGLREQTPDEIEEQFQQTGTIHLFAVAGLHVGMVAYLLWTIARALRLPRKFAICLIIPGLFFYAAITGLNTASIRAALMAALLIGGGLFERNILAGNSLAAAAVLLLCFDTQQLFSTGFQLSFAVVTAIILVAHPVFRALLRWVQHDPFLPRSLLGPGQRFAQAVWRWLARGASVSFASWIGSLPLILPFFYLVTPVSLFANLVVVPIAFFVLAVGLLALLFTPVAPSLAIVFNNANWSLAKLILAAVAMFARAPAGHFYLGSPHLPTGARVEITILDLGGGSSIHLRGRGRDWLIDSGSEGDFKRVVRSYLRSRGINRLDGLILTHGDSRHIGGASAMLRVFRPRELIDTAAPDRSNVHRALVAQLDNERLARQLCGADDELIVTPGVSARVLFPPPNHKGATADDQALVLQFLIENRWRVLCTSDSGEMTERWLLESGLDLRSDILIKGQHHSGISGTPKFLERVQPKAIIASALDFPENERIKDDWAEGVTARGIKLLREDKTGAVTLRFFRDRWEALPYLTKEVFRSDSSAVTHRSAGAP